MNPDEVLRSIEVDAQRQWLSIIGPAKGAHLDDAVTKHNPRRVLEIGTLVGHSTIRMGRLLPLGRKNHLRGS